MRTLRQLAVVLLILTGVAQVRAGEVIDRVIAVVGKRVILESDLDEAVRFEAFAANRRVDALTAADVLATLDRLIDQQLIRDEVGNAHSFAPGEEEVRKQIGDIRAQVAPVGANAWSSALKAYGLSEDAVRDRVRLQLETSRMVNQALRPSVRVDQTEIETYYRNDFLPKLREAGGQDVPLANVNGRIRQILVERKIGELLDSWLQHLRAQVDIRIDASVTNTFATGNAAVNGAAHGER